MKKKKMNKWPILLMVAVLVLILCIVLVIGLYGDGKKPSAGKNPLTSTDQTQNSENDPDGTQDDDSVEDWLESNDWTGSGDADEVAKWQEGAITYKEKKYVYNNKINTYLIMGIDKDGKVETAKDYNSGGQSDAMFLIVTNPVDKTISVVSINRNTMTRVDTYYKSGKRAGYKEAQICVQHGYGDGKRLSCTRAVDAVSHLFYNLPIKGYLSLRMGALTTINDAVGGVEVTVLDDIKYGNVDLKKGETKTLTGQEAYAYLRGRDRKKFDSATNRLRRQEQYINAFSAKLEEATNGNVNKMVNIYESIDDYIVTNIDFASLAKELTTYEYDSSRMYTIPGQTVMGKVYEEYHVDEDKFYDMIVEVFYEEVE